MSSEELSMWMAYGVLEPFGETRADIRAAQICSVIANVNRGKNTKAFQVTDFMPHFDRLYLKDEDQDAAIKAAEKTLISAAPKGAIRVYEGEAPAIRRLGKRGKSAKSGKRKF
jgi:hypothetical protein